MDIAPPVGGKAPAIASKGPTTAPKVGASAASVPKPTTFTPKSPGGKVAANKASTAATTPSAAGQTKLVDANPNQISKLASQAAAKIYNPIMQNYNAQLAQQNGLAQKRSADVNAFNQWYGTQQAALATQETARQTSLNNLLGTLGTPQATTPQNDFTSSIGTNMATPTGGAEQLAGAGSNAAQAGILSTQALDSANNTNNGQNELTAMGGAYLQNSMAAISSDLTKNTTSIEDAQSKAQDEEGTAASKIDTNMTSYLNDQNKNIITSNYDQNQTNNKQLDELVSLAKSLPSVPSALANRIASLSGAAPIAGNTPTAAGEANVIKEKNLGLTSYADYTKRLEVLDTNANNKEKNLIDTIKNNIALEQAGVKVAYTNAQIKYLAAKTGESVAETKTKLNTISGSGTTDKPLTTDGVIEQRTKIANAQDFVANLQAGTPATSTKSAVQPMNKLQVRQYLFSRYGAADPTAWAAFDLHFYGGLTTRTRQLLEGEGFTKQQLAAYKPVKGD